VECHDFPCQKYDPMHNNSINKNTPTPSGTVKIGKKLLENLPPMYRMVAEYKIENRDWELIESTGAAE